MSDRKRNILEALENIDYFGEANPQLAAELPITTALFAANKNNISRFHQAGITSSLADGAGKSGTRSKAARAREIEIDLRRVTVTARLMEKKLPDFQNEYTLPHSRLSYQQVVERANAFLSKSLSDKAGFAQYGLQTAFFDELQTDVDEFQESSHEQADAKRTRVGANAETEVIIEESLDVHEELDRAVKNHYRNNPQKLAEWLTASHIKRKQKKDDQPPDNNG